MDSSSSQPYSQLHANPQKTPIDYSLDIYRNLNIIKGPRTEKRIGAPLLLIMLCICLSVCLLVLTIPPSTQIGKSFDIIVEDYDDTIDTNEISSIERLENNNAHIIRTVLNNRPIIGVLSQELDETEEKHLPGGHNYTAYIAASYIKWVEAAGARAVPVIIGKSSDYYRQLFESINGLLLPGGSAPLTGTGGFAEVGKMFFEWAIEANDAGDYFPIWGTCNGFELLTVVSMKDDQSRLTDCDSQDQALPLRLRGNWKQSLIYGNTPKHILRDITKEKVTINFHHFCLTPTNFTKFGINRFWNALSVNRDIYDLEYISTIEAKNYPFIGVQFHPEKNPFEWSLREPKIPHSGSAVNVANYFGRFFINLSRQSKHSFPASEESEYLIYNYTPLYTAPKSTFEQSYYF